jgi:phosphate transport system protein
MAELGEHIVKRYEHELGQLHSVLVQMGGKVESQLAMAVQAVLERDGEAANAAIGQDQAVDALERDIEQLVVRLFALRQPVAVDLRNIVAGLKISSALERIGDYAANIAKRSPLLVRHPPSSLAGLASMARLVQGNLRLVVDALDLYDPDRAMQVWYADEAVDDLFTVIFRELMTYMMEEPRNITPCTHLLFVSKNLERIGDHTTNIAEMVHYAATGEVRLAAEGHDVSVRQPLSVMSRER